LKGNKSKFYHILLLLLFFWGDSQRRREGRRGEERRREEKRGEEKRGEERKRREEKRRRFEVSGSHKKHTDITNPVSLWYHLRFHHKILYEWQFAVLK
jgi:hypothetical protein